VSVRRREGGREGGWEGRTDTYLPGGEAHKLLLPKSTAEKVTQQTIIHRPGTDRRVDDRRAFTLGAGKYWGGREGRREVSYKWW